MDHNIQKGLFSAGLFVLGLLTGLLVKKLYEIWKNR